MDKMKNFFTKKDKKEKNKVNFTISQPSNFKRKEDGPGENSGETSERNTLKLSTRGQQTIPDALTVDKLFDEIVVKKIGVNINPQMKQMSTENKWKLIQEYKQMDTQDNPQKIIDELKEMKNNQIIKKQTIENIQIITGSSPAIWIEQFIKLNGHDDVFEVLTILMSIQKKTDEDVAMIVNLTRSIKNLMNISEGIEVISKNIINMKILIRTLDYLNIISQDMIIRILIGVAVKNEEGYNNLIECLSQENRQTGRSYFSKVVGFMNTNYKDIKLNSLLLISFLLSPPNFTLNEEKRKNIVTFLEKSNITRIMLQLYAEKDEELNRHLKKFSENNPEFNVNMKNAQLNAIGGGNLNNAKIAMSNKNSLTLLQTLNQQMSSQDAHPFFVTMVENMLLLQKSGKRGIELWSFLSAFIQEVTKGDKESIIEELKHAFNTVMSNEEIEHQKNISSRNLINNNKTEVENLYKKIDELNHELEKYKSGSIVVQPNPNTQGGVDNSGSVPTIDTNGSVSGSEGGFAPPPPIPGTEGGFTPPPPVPGTEGGFAPPPPVPGMEGEFAPPPPVPGMEGDFAPPPPPPGMEGGPPPPPPPGMGGSMKKSLPKKKQPKPQKKMIGLPWAILKPEKVENTFWEKASDEEMLNLLNTSELENIFGKDSAENKPKPKVEKVEKPIEISVIDPKKANNVTIMLSRFKMPFSEIKKAILSVDLEVLNLEKLMLMEPFLPNAEDINAINSYTGEKELLAKGDRFFMEIMDIPRLGPRFQCLIFKENFDEKYSPLQQDVQNTLRACKTLKTSKNFAKLLELVLALGNYMNGGTFRGGAYGFKLATLDQLPQIKGNDGTSLMTYLVRSIRSKFKHIESVLEELECVEQAINGTTKFFLTEAQALQTGLNLVEAQLKNAPINNSDRFNAVLSPFVQTVAPNVDQLLKNAQELNDLFKQLATFFGEDPMMDSDSFFNTILRFCNNYKKVIADEEILEREMMKKNAPLNPQQKMAQVKLELKGELDNIISKMRSGDY